MAPTPSSSVKHCSRVLPSPFHVHHSWLLSLLLLALSPYTTSSSSTKISYADHCDSIVSHSPPIRSSIGSYTYISLNNGFFTGGDKVLAPDQSSASVPSSTPPLPGSFNFYTHNSYPTRTPGVIKIEGGLSFRGPATPFILPDSSSSRARRKRKTPVPYKARKSVDFALSGFWSNTTGNLCMVGSGHINNIKGTTLKSSVVFKLNYPQTSNISTSVVNGIVESLDASDNPAHFDPISVFAYAQNNYIHTKIPQARYACSHVDVHEQVLRFGDSSDRSTCNHLLNTLNGWNELEHGRSCSVLNCSQIGFTPAFMIWDNVACTVDGRVHMHIGFPREINYGPSSIFQPNTSLVAEGVWDPETNKLCLLAFPITIPKNSTVDHASIGDATIGISLWFPAVLTIETRGPIAGRIWSEKDKDSLRYSRAISFRSSGTSRGYLSGVRYEYTRTQYDITCNSNGVGRSGNERYPDGSSIGDLRFDFSLRNDEECCYWGSATPLSLGESFYAYLNADPYLAVDSTLEELNLGIWNVSYMLSYQYDKPSELDAGVDISAEGTYNSNTGTICMVGCQDQKNSDLYRNSSGYPMDCGILITMQLSPMDTGDGNWTFERPRHLNGTIRSTRTKEDPLYFETLEMSSNNMYTKEAIQSMWRMDVEIIMVLVSKTLSCVFIGLQLFHIKKYPDVLSSISILMLIVLTLGHVTPLVLNFEALFFTNRNKQNVLLSSGGWLEVNEVIVRLTTMVAFMLQFRLLQTAWNARSSDNRKKSLWNAERKALGFCLPLYFSGALVAWFVHTIPHQTRSEVPVLDARHNHSIWEDPIRCASLILEGFLLPQIILNTLVNCTDKALSPLYYIGTTVVRAMPHLYDAYRARYYVPSMDSSIIFATPYEGVIYYSYAWDIVIPLAGSLFAVLIFFQQKFGGRCFLPKRFRNVGGYEMVPFASP